MISANIQTTVTDCNGTEHAVEYRMLTRRELQKEIHEAYEGPLNSSVDPIECYADDCNESPTLEVTKTDLDGCVGYRFCSLDCLEYNARR